MSVVQDRVKTTSTMLRLFFLLDPVLMILKLIIVAPVVTSLESEYPLLRVFVRLQYHNPTSHIHAPPHIYAVFFSVFFFLRVVCPISHFLIQVVMYSISMPLLRASPYFWLDVCIHKCTFTILN